MIGKKIALLALSGLSLAACQHKKSNTFTVKGTVKNTTNTTGLIYLEENTADGARPQIVDSARLNKDGSFNLHTTSKEQTIYSLRSGNSESPFALLINDTDEIDFQANLTDVSGAYTAKGSPATEALVLFDKTSNRQAETIYAKGHTLDSLKKAGLADTTAAVTAGITGYTTAADELKTYTLDVINKSKSPVLTLYVLGTYQQKAAMLGLSPLSQMETADVINQAAEKFPEYTLLSGIKAGLKPRLAADFSQPDSSGKLISLSSFRGKYVLVDFWASWCGPCRAENPNVVAAYNKFKDKNFTVLGVSLDRQKAAWQKAIQADGLVWTQVSDLQYWNNAAAVLYGVQGIPYNVLIDPKGNIVGERLTGRALEMKLQEVLK